MRRARSAGVLGAHFAFAALCEAHREDLARRVLGELRQAVLAHLAQERREVIRGTDSKRVNSNDLVVGVLMTVRCRNICTVVPYRGMTDIRAKSGH